MRIRSCQLVYLLLLLCSVQVVDARAAGLLIDEAVGAIASMQDGDSGDTRVALARVEAKASRQAADDDLCGVQQLPVNWNSPARYATAVASYTSFARS